LESPGEWLRGQIGPALDGFFRHPYLLWFVTDRRTRRRSTGPSMLHPLRTRGRVANNMRRWRRTSERRTPLREEQQPERRAADGRRREVPLLAQLEEIQS
jgi:hypothetical protein